MLYAWLLKLQSWKSALSFAFGFLKTAADSAKYHSAWAFSLTLSNVSNVRKRIVYYKKKLSPVNSPNTTKTEVTKEQTGKTGSEGGGAVVMRKTRSSS
jgi:hypothetical protein